LTSNFIAAINDKFNRNAMEIYGNKACLCTDTILLFKLHAYGIKRRITAMLNPSHISSPCKEAAALDAAALDRSSTGNVGRAFARSFDVLFVCMSR
jgi:hypothetical protein